MTTTTTGAELPEWLKGERHRPTLPVLGGTAGALVVLAGMFLLLEGVDPEDERVYGLAVSLFTLLVGFGLMLVERRGALRAAGVALAAGAVAPLAFVLVNDPTDIDRKGDVLVAGVVAVVLWLVLFAFSSARGHGVFLGLALLAAWLSALAQTAPESILFPFFAADSVSVRTGDELETEVPFTPPPSFSIPEPPTPPTFPVPTFTVPTFPEPPTFPPEEQSLARAALVSSSQPIGAPEPPIAPAVVSIAFGAVYLALGVLLDQARLTRLAGAVLAVGVPALAFGVVSVGPRHGATAVGVAAASLGALLVAVGVAGGRRFVGWSGAAVLAGGAIGLVTEAFEDPGRGDAVGMLVVGGALVAAGWFLSQPVAGGEGIGSDSGGHSDHG